MKLTAHFQLEEFTRSATAIRCGIDNTPNEEQIANLKALCEEVLEPLRQHIGKPVVISSGYRCPKLNAAVGGVSNSQHMKGEAADLRIPSLAEGRQWMEWIRSPPTLILTSASWSIVKIMTAPSPTGFMYPTAANTTAIM